MLAEEGWQIRQGKHQSGAFTNGIRSMTDISKEEWLQHLAEVGI